MSLLPSAPGGDPTGPPVRPASVGRIFLAVFLAGVALLFLIVDPIDALTVLGILAVFAGIGAAVGLRHRDDGEDQP